MVRVDCLPSSKIVMANRPHLQAAISSSVKILNYLAITAGFTGDIKVPLLTKASPCCSLVNTFYAIFLTSFSEFPRSVGLVSFFSSMYISSREEKSPFPTRSYRVSLGLLDFLSNLIMEVVMPI